MKKKEKRFPRFYLKSLKTRWIISCISLSLIPLVIGVIIFFNNIATFREQTLRNNESLLVQIHDMMDQGLRDTIAITEDLAEDQTIPIFYSTTEGKNLLIHKWTLQNKLAQYCAYSSYISNIYIYFPKNHETITNQTVASPDILYYMNHHNSALSYEQWLGVIESPHRGEVILLPASRGETVVAYVKSIPSFSDYVNANIIVILDTDTMITMAKNVSGEHFCEFNLLYKGQCILPEGPLLKQEQDTIKEIRILRSGNISRVWSQFQVAVSALPSAVMEFTYLLATPASAYQMPIRNVNILFLAGLLLILIGSIAFTAWFVDRYYSPIREIIKVANTNSGNVLSEPLYDEYNIIKKALSDSQNASVTMMKQLSKQKEQLLNTSLAILLNRYPLLEDPQWKEHQQELRKILNHPIMSVVILCQNNVDEDGFGEFSAEQLDLLASWLQRSDSCLQQIPDFFWLSRLDKCFFILLGFSQKHQADKFNSLLQEEIESLSQKNAKIYPHRILLYPSSFCNSMEQLPDAWDEALYALQYRMLFGVEYTAKQKEITSSFSFESGYYYPPEEESRLLNFVRSGNKEKATVVLENLWNLNLERDRTNAGFAKCLLYHVMGTLIRACSLITPLSSINASIDDTMKKLAYEKNVSNMYCHLVMLLGEICQIYSTEHYKNSDKLKTDIFEYISEHYSDPNLSVEMIGDVFGKSRAYLFSVFKEDTGFSMLYHINKIRIEKAKELLQNPSLPIQDIAQKVGFNSSISFTRAFKKYEGITPSSFREIHG